MEDGEMTALVGDDVLYPELSYKIMECVFEVHNKLGPGFSEDIYEEAIVYEFELRGIMFERQKVITVFYKGRKLGLYRLDLVVDEKIILEFKAVTDLNNLFKQQLTSYLKATDMKLGILINFGSKRVEYVRVANSK